MTPDPAPSAPDDRSLPLHADHAALHAVLQALPDAVVVMDRDFVIRFVNDAAGTLFGWSARELMGRPVEALIPARFHDGHRDRFTRLLERVGLPAVGFERGVVGLASDGREFPAEVSLGPISVGGDRLTIAVIRDITARRATETALAETRARMKSQFMHIPNPVYVWQAQGDDFVLVDCNEMARTVTGGRIAEHMGVRASAFYATRPDIVDDLRTTLARRGTMQREMRYSFISLRLDRELAVTFAYAEPDLVIAHAVDITDRNAAMRALRAAETRLRDAVDASPGAVLILDPEDRVLMVNRAWRDWYGGLFGDVPPGMPYEELVRRLADTGLWDPMGPPEATVQERLRVHRTAPARFEHALADGRTMLISESRAEDGCTVIVHTDITELRRVDRLKDEFVSMVSHELRTPLTSIKGSLDLLAAGVGTGPGADVDRLVGIARRNADRLLTVVNDILDSQKIASGTITYVLRAVPVRGAVERAVAANRLFADRFGVRIRVGPCDAAHVVRADAERLGQVLTNLLSNAAKFSPAGGMVAVTAARRGRMIRISVRDRGSGIPDAFRKRVFDRFAQADVVHTRTVSGTGLGLSIARTLVEAMGGTIGFVSPPGGGCVFHVDLPAEETASNRPPAGPNDRPPVAPGRRPRATPKKKKNKEPIP